MINFDDSDFMQIQQKYTITILYFYKKYKKEKMYNPVECGLVMRVNMLIICVNEIDPLSVLYCIFPA